MRSRLLPPVLVLAALVAVATGTEYVRRTRIADAPSANAASSPSAGLPRFEPYAVEPFSATDIDGRDVSSSTWAGKVVVVNFWATWCAPCRREIPALATLQDAYRGRVLVLGALDDNVTDEFAREFGRTVGINYPIVRTSFEIERRFPMVAALPMTFIVDRQGRVITMYAGEIDPRRVEQDLRQALADR
jgi:thiol-disulfide isomerase/thioredoxin